MNRTQRLDSETKSSGGWESFAATTRVHGEIQSRCDLKTPILSPIDGAAPFLDIGITEFVGITQRAKYCSVRLEEPAMRKLYEVLRAKFDGAAT